MNWSYPMTRGPPPFDCYDGYDEPAGLYPGYYYRADVKGDRFPPPTLRARARRSTSSSFAPPMTAWTLQVEAPSLVSLVAGTRCGLRGGCNPSGDLLELDRPPRSGRGTIRWAGLFGSTSTFRERHHPVGSPDACGGFVPVEGFVP